MPLLRLPPFAAGLALGLALAAPVLAGSAVTPPAATGTAATAPAAEAPLRLIMVERAGCIYCEAWRNEVMPEYAATPEGKAAPLTRIPIDGPWPDGLALARAPFITPTFILIQDGKEIDRLEGYPGEMHFWPLLGQMIARAGVALPPAGGES